MTTGGIIYITIRTEVADGKDFHVTMDETDYEVEHPLVSHTEMKSTDPDSQAVVIALYLEANQDEDGLDDIVSDLDYSFSDDAIVTTEIVSASFEAPDTL